MKLVKDVAKELKISKSVIKEMIRNKKVSYEFKDGTYYVNQEDVVQKLNNTTNNNCIKVQDKLFLKCINTTIKDFNYCEKTEYVKLLLKELSIIKKTRRISLLRTVELYKYLEKCLQYTDYTSAPRMEAEHQYMFDFLSKYFVKESIGSSGGFMYSYSNELEAALQMIKPQISKDITLTDAEMCERLEAFLKRDISIDESEFDSLDDLFR